MELHIEGIEHAQPVLIMVSKDVIRIEFQEQRPEAIVPGNWIFDTKAGGWRVMTPEPPRTTEGVSAGEGVRRGD